MNTKLSLNFYDYEETCRKIKAFGIIPEENPSEAMICRLRSIVDRCLSHYKPMQGEFILKGVYLYREYEQAGELRQTYGNAHEIGKHEALIGLSYGLLEQSGMPVFHDLVFVHELAHLTEWEHNEIFQNRFNDLEFDYYFYNRIRADGKAQSKPNRRGWKM